MAHPKNLRRLLSFLWGLPSTPWYIYIYIILKNIAYGFTYRSYSLSQNRTHPINMCHSHSLLPGTEAASDMARWPGRRPRLRTSNGYGSAVEMVLPFFYGKTDGKKKTWFWNHQSDKVVVDDFCWHVMYFPQRKWIQLREWSYIFLTNVYWVFSNTLWLGQASLTTCHGVTPASHASNSWANGMDPKGWSFGLPSGYVNRKLLKMAIEIVDFPMKNGDFP